MTSAEPEAMVGSDRSACRSSARGERLLVHAQHHRALGRVQIQPDDATDLLDEQRVTGELPRLLTVRLQPERPPDPQHGRLRQTDLARHRPRRPVRRVARRRLQRLDDHLLDLLVGDRPRPPRPRLIRQAIQAVLGKPRPPLGGHPARDPQPHRDLGVLEATGRQEHDPRPQGQRLRARPPSRPAL
jgi:hypothetical protein